MKCPYCGRDIYEHKFHQHDKCPKQYAVQVKVKLSMVDPARPGYARRKADYDQTRIPGAPSSTALFAYYGTWNKAVTALGLLPVDNRRKRGQR